MYVNFNDKDYVFKGDGVTSTATKNTTTNIDFKVDQDFIYVNGAEFIQVNAVFGDYVECQVIDIDNVLGMGANTVLTQYLTKWYIDPSTTRFSLESPYAGNVPNGCYMRAIYHSVGTSNDVDIAINYFFHKGDA